MKVKRNMWLVAAAACGVAALAWQAGGGLAFTEIRRDDSGVTLKAEWDPGTVFVGDALDLFFSPVLAVPGWRQLDRAVGVTGATPPEHTFMVPWADIPEGAASGFFRMADAADSDGDGMTDAYERWVTGTDPDVPDENKEVVGGIEVKDDEWRWYDTSGQQDLTELYGVGGGCAQLEMPFPVVVSGVELTELTVLLSGRVEVSAEDQADGTFTVDGFGADGLRPAAGLDSALVYAAEVVTNGVRHCVIEYRNMYSSWEEDGLVSLQIVFAEGAANKVWVSFREVEGAADGRTAELGVVAPSQTLRYADNVAGSVRPGMTLLYMIGTDPEGGDGG